MTSSDQKYINLLEEESKKQESNNNIIDDNIINSISDALNATRYCFNPNNWFSENEKNKGLKDYHSGFGIWFRGEKDKTHSENQHNLIPGIFRSEEVEMSLVRHFQTRAPFYRNENRSIFEWLCLMQHYQAPTRLLDWTENILYSLHFALDREENENKKTDDREDYGNKKTDRLIFVLSSWQLNACSNTIYLQGPGNETKRKRIQTPFDFNTILRANMAISDSLLQLLLSHEINNFNFNVESPPNDIWRELLNRYPNIRYPDTVSCPRDSNVDPLINEKVDNFLDQIKKPVAAFPYRNNPRLHTQQGTFTIHGGKKDDNYLYDIEKIGNPIHFKDFQYDELKTFMKVYRIKGNKVDDLKKELKLLRINRGLLFPELDYQSQYLKNLWDIAS